MHSSFLVSHASPSHTKREKGSGQKGRTNVSGWNAIIIGNSGVRKIETNCHFRTVCIGQAHARKYRPHIPLMYLEDKEVQPFWSDPFSRVHEGGWAWD